MKKNKMLGWALMTLATITSCTNDTEFLTQGNEIKLTSEIIRSRVTSDLQSTQIAEGQKIGVTITGSKSGNDYVNKLWTSDGEGGLSTEHPVYWANTDINVTAYHPYNVDWTSGTQTFTVNTDQSVEANYLDSDLLWATKTGTKADETVALTFAHKLAKVNVILTSEDITDLSGATISICNTNTSVKFNTRTGELSYASDIANIIAGVTTTKAYTASAIIVPQTVTNGTLFIKVDYNGKIFYYKLSADKEFKAGYSYNYTLNVKEKLVEVELKSDNISDWTDEDIAGYAEEFDFSWFNPNQYISYVANHQISYNTDPNARDYFYHYRSYITCPSMTISKMEIKFQMANVEEWLEEKPLYIWSGGGSIVLAKNYISFCGYGGYQWDEWNVSKTDKMVLTLSYKDKYIKLNGVDVEHMIGANTNSTKTSGYFFSDYYREYDEGEYKDWSGVTEGSKLYYVKFWNENDELIYLGAASTGLNPNTNKVENCWRSYFNETISLQFAHYSPKLSNYKPYGGGID